MLIVPLITVSQGRIVRLTQGKAQTQKFYDQNPIDLGQSFVDNGITRIHLVDLDGARGGDPKNLAVLSMLSAYTDLKVNFAGGVHTDGGMMKVFEAGAKSIALATVSVYKPQLFSDWIMSYGREKIVLAADTFEGNIRVGGWQKDTRIKLFDHVQRYYDLGLKYLKTTDISRDGALSGPSVDIYESIVAKFPDLKLFASGGIRNLDDLKKLKDVGVSGAILGRAFYEGEISLKDMADFIS